MKTSIITYVLDNMFVLLYTYITNRKGGKKWRMPSGSQS